jgi:hypothetical protein
VNKTTVYLPDALKHALRRAATQSGRSEAELIREGVTIVTQRTERPRPRGALFASGLPSIARRVDEELAGFGED